jgi:hypothetical protein
MTREFVEQAFHAATWGNTTETSEDWLKVLNGCDSERRQGLFEKIFREDFSGTLVKKLFSRNELLEFLDRMDRPFHRREAERRRLVWRSVYLGTEAAIPELAWVILPREPH